jgi:hypothetical protein
MSLSLAACKTPLPAVEFRTPPADVPDAALVAPCDTSDNATPTNGALAEELNRVRGQRNECAIRMDGVRQHRDDELRRASNPR